MSQPPPEGWYPDPSRRNDLRFWNGRQWTEHIVTSHVQAVDPLRQPTVPVQQSAPPTSVPVAAVEPEIAAVPEAATDTDSPFKTAATALGVAGLLSVVTPGSGGSGPAPQPVDFVPAQASRISATPRKDRLLPLEDPYEPVPTFEGWYSDARTGGTKYWDGSRWSGDTRPPRKPFAAPHGWGPLPYLLLIILIMFFFLGIGVYNETGNFAYSGWTIVVFVFVLPLALWLARGKGPSTSEVQHRLAELKKDAKKKRRSANVATFVSGFGRKNRPTSSTDSAAEAARISALADPKTAEALQNLQNLLYTQVLTDEEFQAAKDRLLGPSEVDQIAQIEQLAELHRQGVLGDLEFASAKSRILEI